MLNNKTIKEHKGKLVRIQYRNKINQIHDMTCEIVASTKYHILININKSGLEKAIEYKQIVEIKSLKNEVRNE